MKLPLPARVQNTDRLGLSARRSLSLVSRSQFSPAGKRSLALMRRAVSAFLLRWREGCLLWQLFSSALCNSDVNNAIYISLSRVSTCGMTYFHHTELRGSKRGAASAAITYNTYKRAHSKAGQSNFNRVLYII